MESVFKKEIVSDKAILRSLAALFFIISISLGAFVRIPLPFTPVPLTLQTFFVLLSAAILGIRLGLFTLLAYIFLGFTGVPVFTGASMGLLYLVGPTAGYIAGFVLAAIVIGGLIKYAKENLFLTIGIFFLANLLLLLCGVIWLKVSLHLNWIKSFSIGFIPFLPGDITKAALAAFLFWKLKPRMKSIL